MKPIRSIAGPAEGILKSGEKKSFLKYLLKKLHVSNAAQVNYMIV